MKKFMELLRILAKLIPVLGDILDNIDSLEGGKGKFLTPAFIKQVVRLIVALVTLYLIIKGEASLEDLDTI